MDRIGRCGEGPGEFAEVLGIAIGEADSIFVLDNFLGRVSVYTPDLEFSRIFRLGFFPDGPALFIGAALLINTGIRTGDVVGVPFHVFDRDGRRLRSFGSVAGGLTSNREIRDRRTLARADSASFWAARINQYLIERWTMDGRLLETLQPGDCLCEPRQPLGLARQRDCLKGEGRTRQFSSLHVQMRSEDIA